MSRLPSCLCRTRQVSGAGLTGKDKLKDGAGEDKQVQ
jgi:hypothetical protein